MTPLLTRAPGALRFPLASLAVIGLSLLLPGIAHAAPPSSEEQAFNRSLANVRDQLTQAGKHAQEKRLAPYRKFALQQAAERDVGPVVRSGNAALRARGRPVLPEPTASDKSFTGWNDPKLETAPGDAARAARLEARAAGKSRPVRLNLMDSHDAELARRGAAADAPRPATGLRWSDPGLRTAPGDAARAARIQARAGSGQVVRFRALDSHDVQLANRRAEAPRVRFAPAERSAAAPRYTRARVSASGVRTARVARTSRTAATAARTARAAHTAEDAAKVGRAARLARVGVGATGAGLAVVGAQEGLKATTGLNVPVTEYGVRMLFTPVVAAEGGNAGQYAAAQNKWFANTVNSSGKTFVRTFRDPKQFNRNINNYARENAPALKTARCVLATPVRGVQALIAHRRMKGC